MSPQLRVLVWKEWRERRVLFLVCLLWMVGGTAYDLARAWLHGHGGVVSSISITYYYGLFMPIFLAMRTSLGETTDRTRAFASALPISGERRGWVRLGGGLAVLIVPILVSAILTASALTLGWIDRSAIGVLYRESALPVLGVLARTTAIEVSSATSLYVLLSLVGTALRAEAHAGFVGAAVAILWYLGSFVDTVLWSRWSPEVAAWVATVVPRAAAWNCGYDPHRGLRDELRISSMMLAPLLLHALLQLAMAVWFVRRYRRSLPGRVVEAVYNAPSLLWHRWTFSFPNRSLALAWLTLRQAVPMCLPGLLIACLMTSLLVVSRFSMPAIRELRVRGELLGAFAEALPTSMLMIGLLWSVVVGAGVFAAEIDWRVGEFWRTRPIPFRRFFAVKFFVGLSAVLVVLDATALVFSWSFPAWASAYNVFNWPYLACVVPLHAVMFATAAAWTCVLRRPVLAGVAAIVSFALLEELLSWSEGAARHLDPIVVYLKASRGGIGLVAQEGYPVVAAGMVVAFVALTVVTALALRRYDPCRQSG